jgi:hypothetical protein
MEDLEKGADPRRSRTLLSIVSFVTAVWLALELFAIATLRSTTWPFSALVMFSEPREEAVVVTLTGATLNGVERVDGDDFGFAGSNQLHAYVRVKVVKVDGRSVTVRRGGVAATRSLARLYNGRHDVRLQRLSVRASVTGLPRGADSSERRFLVLTVRP